jgi:hypothetical protein
LVDHIGSGNRRPCCTQFLELLRREDGGDGGVSGGVVERRDEHGQLPE